MNKMNKDEYQSHVIDVQSQLIALLYSQVVDLTMMSKIELGDDVIKEYNRLRGLLKQDI